MNKDEVRVLQTGLAAAGFYHGEIDGLWGPMTAVAQKAALDATALRAAIRPPFANTSPPGKLAWGKDVSPAFRAKVHDIAGSLQVEPSELMACMAWESGETFSPSVMNKAGSGAVGLIQFMPSTAHALGTSSAGLAAMSAESQLDYVHKYFSPYKGKLHSLADIYMVILWPLAVGKPESYVLFDRSDKQFPARYLQNKGIDLNGDGLCTKAEATAKVKAKLDKGMLSAHLSQGV